MGIRKNAKFLSPTEKESFVRACVLLKADIVNSGAPAAQQYSKWDEYVAIHRMIQNAFAPGAIAVNFGHGGNGAFSFLSWHRYFLFRLELDLQSKVPGVMMPYWDWTDPAPIMTDTFLGPNGGAGSVVQQGYFAVDRPGLGVNVTALPGWWPPTLAGWTLPTAFGPSWVGGLRRNLSGAASLPTPTDLQQTLAKSTYSAFQLAAESGQGISSFPSQQMHNGMHVWIGGHMGNPAASPFDPIFYLHHCNIDRLWAMWQMDGHATDYPTTGGNLHHHRDDIMYPWTGGAAGYGTNSPIATSIPMPDFSALGAQHNVDTLDFRTAYGYTYDTLAVIGIGLDRTGSMLGVTPDPMTSGAPDVTKWEAAKRGVSAFLQDCETVQQSGVTYVMAGVKTFRRTFVNDFATVFGAPGYGLIKNGSSFSKATFDANIASMTPGGSTPLADALLDVQTTLVEPPFAGVPADERRYLAMLTDGLLTSGAPMSSIADGSFTRTAVFGMGFGTGAEVDYPTIASLVAKGITLPTTQVFHGENAGTIDKFYSNALAAAIGFTTIFDPVIELFAGEHSHINFDATSADDVFMITAQGMDFDDNNWSFHLHGPNNLMLYGHEGEHQHDQGCHHCCPLPVVTATRANGRLSLLVQRGTAGAECWVGTWSLMVAYKARHMDAMLMPEIGDWLFPVSAGPVRGLRYSRLLQKPAERTAKRNVIRRPLHILDAAPTSTNRNDRDACDMIVNIYARTGLRIGLQAERNLVEPGAELSITVNSEALSGTAIASQAFARVISPAVDLANVVARVKRSDIPPEAVLEGSQALKFDPARLLAALERKDRKLATVRDKAVTFVRHHEGPLHFHEKETEVPGVYHLGVYVEGTYFPNLVDKGGAHGGHSASPHDAGTLRGEPFTRLLNISVAVATPPKQSASKSSTESAKKSTKKSQASKTKAKKK